MAGYRKLISEKTFLKVRLRARALLRDGSDLVAIEYKERTLRFQTASGTYGRRVIWTQTLEITDVLLENILAAKSFRDVESLIKNSDLKVHCNCPAFQYWGFKYIAWKKGYGLQKETRRPMVKNPHQQGFVCKHLYLVLSLYPFWSKALAKKFKDWADSKVKDVESANTKFNSPRMNTINREYADQIKPPKEGNENQTEGS